MKIIEQISQYLANFMGIEAHYIKLTLATIMITILFNIAKVIIKKVYATSNVSDKKKFTHNRKMQIALTIINILIALLIWNQELQGIMTLVSFISAGIAIAIRGIIFNFFAGIYIQIAKPFELEDRIEIGDLKGDVINIHALVFEMLEVGQRVNGEQSSGRIVHVPNSLIFEKPLKNYVKAFKYIWNETTISIDINSDIEKTKEVLYTIVNNNEILKTIPRKMEDAMDEATIEYRIYYNNLEPIIYTKIVEDHIEVYLRYLVHPKKVRMVEEDIFEKVIQEYKEGNIQLYEKKK